MAKASALPIALAPVSRYVTLSAAAVCLLPLLLQLPGRLMIGVAAIALAVPMLARRGDVPAWLRFVLVIALLATVLSLYRFSFGRDTGCALLAAMLAIKPVELRGLRDARSLLGFGLFAPFATFLLDQSPLSLGLGLIAAAAALIAMLQLSDDESSVRSGPWWRGLGIALRLIGIGLPVALVAFWLFPRLGTPLWGVPQRALARPGLSERMSPGDWVELLGDDSPALRATFHTATPPQSQMYWRGPVLWRFDGRSWIGLDWPESTSPAVVTPGAQIYDYDMELEPTDRPQMVALELLLEPPGQTRLDHDHSLEAAQPLFALSRWRMRSSPPLRFEAELHPALRAIALELPVGYNPRTLALGERWRREAGEDDAAIVERALRWVRAEFAYTLDPPTLGRHSVDEFLFETKTGFCEHYSSAFVVLMRAAGIPARVVTGYVGGYRNPIGGYWLVRRSDAHAWSEIWMRERGWVRIDPTAAIAPERIYDTLDDRTPGAFGGFTGLSPMFDVGDWLRRGWNDFVLGFNAARQRRILESLGMPDLDGSRLASLFVLATGLALAAMYWLTTRREREPDPILRAWRRLERRYQRIGLGREPYEPAARWAQRVLEQHPQAQTLAALSARFSDWRYASNHGEAGPQTELIRDLLRHRPDTQGDSA